MVLMQVISLIGAGLVLLAFGGQQFAGMDPEGLTYGVLNLVGSLLLAASAISPTNAGVLVLETTWALISLSVILKALRARDRR